MPSPPLLLLEEDPKKPPRVEPEDAAPAAVSRMLPNVANGDDAAPPLRKLPPRRLPPVEAADDIESPTCVPEVEVLRVMVVHDAPRREGRVAVVERPDHRRRVVADRVGHGVRREAELGALDEPAVEEVGGGRTRARDLVVRGFLNTEKEKAVRT